MVLLSRTYRSRPSVWALDRTSRWWDSVVPAFTDAQWLENFRMSKDTFTFLCEKLRPAVEREDTSFRHCVPLKKRVAIALWKFATGSEYQTIAKLFGVSCTTVCRCVQDFCAAAKKFLVPEQIRIPDKGRCRETESGWALPQCVGAIGSYHGRIVAPQYSHTDYCNREGLHSIILQGVVVGRGKFWNVFAGLAGSLHNTEVLRL